MTGLRTAIIGVGHQGKYHAEKYASLPGSELVGVVDLDHERGQALANALGVGFSSDYRKLIGQVEAVSIAVPTSKHFEIASAFLESGTHVLLEKPMTSTVEQAARLVTLAEENDLVLQVGHLERFNSAILALDGYCRNPRFIESYRIAPFKERGTDINVVLDLMIHDIDLIQGIVRSPIQQLDASGTPVISKEIDVANARIRFDNGCVANVTASRVSLKTERRIRIFQDDAYMSVDMHTNALTVYKKGAGSADSELPGIAVDKESYERSDALKLQIEAFLESIRSRKPPVVPGIVGKQALETAIRISELVNKNNATEPGRLASRG